MPIFNLNLNQPIDSPVLEFTANLAQGIGTFDLLTATGDVWIDNILYYMAVGATLLTSVSFQTNQTTPYVLMSATEGLLVNLTSQKTINPAAPQDFQLRSGQKIQYSLLGLTGTGSMKVDVRYRSVSPSAFIS